MLLSFFGLLVDPTDIYGRGEGHRKFSLKFVTFITSAVSAVTILSGVFVVSWAAGLWDDPLTPSSTSSPMWVKILGAYCGLELGFWAYCLWLERKFSKTTSFDHLDAGGRSRAWAGVLNHCDNPWAILPRWFYAQGPETVGEGCMEEWLSWAFFSKHKMDLEMAEMAELREMMDDLISKHPDTKPKKPEFSSGFEPSSEQKVDFMRLHFDKLVVQHKPFIAYVVISAMQLGGGLFLSHRGFIHHSLPGSALSYWSYKPHDSEKSKSPILLIPGIGIGVTMYINVVKALLQQNREIYILNLPHISLKILHSVPSVEETLEAIDAIYENHGLRACAVLAHSYGSIVAAWVLRYRKEREYFDSLVLVDPVCFALWQPDLIYNFLYRKPVNSPIRRVAQYFVAQDLLVAATLFRHFWWLENLLYPEDVGQTCPSSVFLSSHDFIIDAGATGDYLRRRLALGGHSGHFVGTGNTGSGNNNENSPAKNNFRFPFSVREMKGLSHGSFLNSGKWTREIVGEL